MHFNVVNVTFFIGTICERLLQITELFVESNIQKQISSGTLELVLVELGDSYDLSVLL